MTRIVFNGQEYPSRESMPPEVRSAYEAALSGLAAAGRHALEGSALGRALLPLDHSEHFLRAHNRAKRDAARILPILLTLVMGVMTVAGVYVFLPLILNPRSQNGGFSIGTGLLMVVVVTAMAGIGLAVLVMYRKLDAPETAATNASPPDQGVPRILDGLEHVLARLLQLLLAAAAGGVIAATYWIISNMDPGSRTQGGHIYVAVGALVALACLVGMFVAAEMRLRK